MGATMTKMEYGGGGSGEMSYNFGGDYIPVSNKGTGVLAQYETKEVKVGTLENKPLYRKTIRARLDTSTEETHINLNIPNLERYILNLTYTGYIWKGDVAENTFGVEGYFNTDWGLVNSARGSLYMVSDYIQLNRTGNTNALSQMRNTTFTVEYTKTTD